MVPIETPLALSGFTDWTLKEFGPMFQQMGLQAVQGGAAGSVNGSQLAAGWRDALKPGETIAGVLVSGDKSITGMGTVTYNDGKRVYLVDDVLATGGTLEATLSLLAQAGATVSGVGVLVELGFLGGRDKVRGHELTALLTL